MFRYQSVTRHALRLRDAWPSDPRGLRVTDTVAICLLPAFVRAIDNTGAIHRIGLAATDRTLWPWGLRHEIRYAFEEVSTELDQVSIYAAIDQRLGNVFVAISPKQLVQFAQCANDACRVIHSRTSLAAMQRRRNDRSAIFRSPRRARSARVPSTP